MRRWRRRRLSNNNGNPWCAIGAREGVGLLWVWNFGVVNMREESAHWQERDLRRSFRRRAVVFVGNSDGGSGEGGAN